MIYIYTIERCPYCNNAEKLLNKVHLQYKVIEVSGAEKEKIKRQNGLNTFPQIFINKPQTKSAIMIGGYNELVNILNISIKMCAMGVDTDAIKYLCSNIKFE